MGSRPIARRSSARKLLLSGACVVALLGLQPSLGHAQATAAGTASFHIAPQKLGDALKQFAEQSRLQILFAEVDLSGRSSPALDGSFAPREALQRLLAGSGLQFEITDAGAVVIRKEGAAGPKRAGAELAPAAQTAQIASASLRGVADGTEEIIVTANKRAELLRNAPISVSAITRAQLDKFDASRFDDYLTRIPAMAVVSQRPGITQLTLRGITSGPQQPNATVGTYFDETPLTISSVFAVGSLVTPDLDTMDMQRVEVLRGPQGTLYGASTLGGLLKYVTTPPSTNEFSARVQLQGSTVEHGGAGGSAKATVNVPLTDQVAVRASAYRRLDPGYVDDTSRDRHQMGATRVDGGRLAIAVKPNDWLDARYTVMAQNMRGQGASQVDVSLPSLRPLYGDLQQRRLIDDDFNVRYRVFNQTLRADLGFAELISSTSFNTLHGDVASDSTTQLGMFADLFGFPGAGVRSGGAYDHRKATQEFRLSSTGENLVDWQLGLFGTHERTDFPFRYDIFNPRSTALIAGAPLIFAQRLAARFTEMAGFGSATWHVSQTFDVTVGVRESSNKQHFAQGVFGELLGTSTMTTTSSDSAFTYLVNPRWKPNDDVMVYGRIAKGYRAGGPNIIVPGLTGNAPASFDPDSLVSYEAGVKAALLDRRLTVDVAAFYVDWSNVQLTVNQDGFSFMGNGGAAISKGVEWTIGFQPITGLTLATGGSYLRAELTADAPGVGGRKGDQQPGVPRWSISMDADYEWVPVAGWKANVGSSWRAIGPRFTDYSNIAERTQLKSYNVVDLRAGIAKDNWSVNVHGKNVGDNRGVTNVATQTPTIGTASYIQPRTWLLTTTYEF